MEIYVSESLEACKAALNDSENVFWVMKIDPPTCPSSVYMMCEGWIAVCSWRGESHTAMHSLDNGAKREIIGCTWMSLDYLLLSREPWKPRFLKSRQIKRFLLEKKGPCFFLVQILRRMATALHVSLEMTIPSLPKQGTAHPQNSKTCIVSHLWGNTCIRDIIALWMFLDCLSHRPPIKTSKASWALQSEHTQKVNARLSISWLSPSHAFCPYNTSGRKRARAEEEQNGLTKRNECPIKTRRKRYKGLL